MTLMRPWISCLVTVAALLVWAPPASADDGFAPTVSLGVFAEFGDEAGIAGGFELWVGASYYPDVDHQARESTTFVSGGVAVRTGMIPLLTGPNQLAPQLRIGRAWLGGLDYRENDTEGRNLTFSRAKVYAIVGYRWAAEFGLDNLDRRRKAEDAFRLGIGGVVPAWHLATDAPIPNGADVIVDVNRNGTIDRFGFDVVLGF